MPRNVNKKAYDEAVKGLKGIKTALKECKNKDHLHSIVASYSGIDIHRKEIQDYINKNDKKRIALIELEGKIAIYLDGARRLYGNPQPEPEVLVGKSEDKTVSLNPEELSQLDMNSRSTEDVPNPTPVDVPKPIPVDATKKTPVDVPKPTPVDAIKKTPVDVPKPTPVDATKKIPVDVPKPTPVDATKKTPVDVPKTTPVDATKNTPVNVPKTPTVPTPADTAKAASDEELLKAQAEQKRSARERQLSAFTNSLKQLILKRDEFHERYPQDSSDDQTKVYGVSCQLVNTLEKCSESYINGTSDLEQFKKDTSQAIRDKRNGVLSEHRGYKEIIANLLLAIGTLGIGYAVAALFSQILYAA